jgi:hypothetical protein
MSLVVVADPDLQERMRCIRIVANQTAVSAVGAATWHELDQVLEDASHDVGLVLYSPSLKDAPSDALERLRARPLQLVVAASENDHVEECSGLARENWPIDEKRLIIIAKNLSPPVSPGASFLPVDLLQMVTMSGGSHILVLSNGDMDVGFIEVRDGVVWTALDALGAGEAAFARLVRPEIRARFGVFGDLRKERTISKAVQTLVLESLQSFDEGRVELPPPLRPTQSEALLSSPESPAARIEALNKEARQLLMKRSYNSAARVLLSLSELDPTSHLVRANLEQLRRLGYPE